MNNKIIIFDTTLRDGEQSPGASMNIREKLEVARQLVRLGVDVIEAGFPIASPGDYEAVKAISQEIRGPVICGLARAIPKDIDRAASALKYTRKPRIHVFLATSKIHMKYKLRKAEEEILKQAVAGVRYARKFVKDVEFSPEDASRTDPEFLSKVVDAVIEAGASTVNIPDTVGYSTPVEFGNLIKWLIENTPRLQDTTLSVHCHNDLGLSVANSLSAIVNGARQVECTINGIGERAGNCSMEEIVMAIATRKDFFKVKTDIDTTQIIKASRLVSRLTGIIVQPNKAIVGENAFAHEAGIHQDGVLKKRSTYEIMHPKDVGLTESKLVLGKHSGRHAFKVRLKELGHKLKEIEINKAFDRFKELADRKKTVYDEDIEALVETELSVIPQTYELDYLNVTCGNRTVPTATVKIKKNKSSHFLRGAKSRRKNLSKISSFQQQATRYSGKELDKEIFEDAACGDGPIDAACRAIDRITGIGGKLIDYNLKAVTGGKDALGEVNIKLKADENGPVVSGRGSSTDIIEASVRAYLNAINKLIFLQKKKIRKTRKR